MLRSLATLAFVLFVSAPAFAQGRVTGTVKDAGGHAVKGATIAADNPNLPSVTVTSDAKGRYSFLGLRGGTWTFTAHAPGFFPAKRQSTTRTMGTNANIDFELLPLTDTNGPGPMATLNTAALQQQLAAAAQLEQEDKIDEAIAAYKEVLTRVPALTTVHLQLGILYERKQDKASAVAEYEAALKADPANAKARAALDRLAKH
jgi:tetratricopeptide (TPR) repeat protein